MMTMTISILMTLALAGSAISHADPTNSTPETMLFLGNSITAQGGYVREIDTALKNENPNNPPRVINRGKPSETVSGLSEAYHPGLRPNLFTRLDDELKNTKPNWVITLYGINDGIYHPFDEKRFLAYKEGVLALIQKVHAVGSHIILFTATPYADPGPLYPPGTDAATREQLLLKANEQALGEEAANPNKFGYRTAYPYYDHVMKIYAEWLLSLNDPKKDVWVIDLRNAVLPKLKECYGSDHIHPNANGHHLMAETFLQQWPRIKKEAGEK